VIGDKTRPIKRCYHLHFIIVIIIIIIILNKRKKSFFGGLFNDKIALVASPRIFAITSGQLSRTNTFVNQPDSSLKFEPQALRFKRNEVT
jgi:hypothetical protein